MTGFQAIIIGSIALGVGGCVIKPEGNDAEVRRATEAGAPFQEHFDTRNVPDLQPNPSAQELLQRAFLTNGTLEAAWFDWRAALYRVVQESTWPNTSVDLGFDYLFSSENLKSWDRTTLSATFDEAPTLPNKIAMQGQIALSQARVAGEKFRAAKFKLQKDVLDSWFDYISLEQRTRLHEQNVELLKQLVESADARVQAGGAQQDLIRAQLEYRLAENQHQSLLAQLPAARARLNALLSRSPDAPLPPPVDFPAPRSLPGDDATLLALASEQNPDLAELLIRSKGQEDVLQLARLRYLPDINIGASLTGDVAKTLGGALMVPLNFPAIQASIDEAMQTQRSVDAMLRQTRQSQASEVVATLLAIRNEDRQLAFLNADVLPPARQLIDSTRQSYSAGTLTFSDLLDSQRTVIEVQELMIESHTAREKYVVALETLAATDLETLTTQPATAPVAENPTSKEGLQ